VTVDTHVMYILCLAQGGISVKVIKIKGRRDSTVGVTVVRIKFQINLRTKIRRQEVHSSRLLIKNRKTAMTVVDLGRLTQKRTGIHTLIF
jgi:hypothetical protein